MSLKESSASSLVYGIVVGGGEDDPAPDQSNGLRVYFPSIHGKDVNIKHLAFSPRLLGPDRQSMQSFSGGLDYGSLVVAYKDTGSNQCQILGLANDLNNRENSIGGNSNLLFLAPQIAAQFTRQMGINRPPKVQKSSEGGAEIYKIQEQGAHFHDLLKGLPTHGALFPMAGLPIDPVKAIRTAIAAASAIPSAGLLASLPGIVMSLGTLANTILANRNNNKKLKTSVPRDTFNAFVSMSTLIQSMEQGEGAGFLTGGKVDEETYVNNAIDLISQTSNVSDLMTVMNRLQSDETLFGMDKYGPTIVDEESPFGAVQRSYTPSGKQATLTPAVVAAGASAISSLMSSAGFPSVIPGQNMFGESAGTILNMMQRIPGGGFGQALSIAQALNTSGAAQQLFSVANEVFSGGNPLNKLTGGG